MLGVITVQMSKAYELDCELMNCRRELRALGVGMPGDQDESSVLARKIDGAADKRIVYGDILMVLMGIYVEWFRGIVEDFKLTCRADDCSLVISDRDHRHKFLINMHVECSGLTVHLEIDDKCSVDLGSVVKEDYTCVSDLIKRIAGPDVPEMIRMKMISGGK